MPSKKRSTSSSEKNISITGDVKDSVVIAGDNNTVNQTIIQKFFNIFKSDSETLEQRNRRILLGHVENAWIKGVLDASLHGAALLDLGIKEEPNAVKTYPWAIKKESTDETLPAGMSMLEIFDSIGMGRSLLILGAPGSGKTTMLLELARQLIARAREDVTQPIPMVFNLASWTEKLSLADWLAQELNNLYSVPRKTAPDWVKGDKLLLLLDGLDEVRQESRAKCVEAINAFRKDHGLTSITVCSRSQDYADLNAKLSFEGAIEVQPLTQKQITEFFNRFGKEMTGIKQVLKKDSALREMAETPLFLSIMIMAYRDKQDVDILISGDEKAQRKHLFDTYIECMFERSHNKNVPFKNSNVIYNLSWLANKIIEHNAIPFMLENMQPDWVIEKKWGRRFFFGLMFGIIFVSFVCGYCFFEIGFVYVCFISDSFFINFLVGIYLAFEGVWFLGLKGGLFFGIIFGLLGWPRKIEMVDKLTWKWKPALYLWTFGAVIGGVAGFLIDLLLYAIDMSHGHFMLIFEIFFGGVSGIIGGFRAKPVVQTSSPGERIYFSKRNAVIILSVIPLVLNIIIVLALALSPAPYTSVLFLSLVVLFGGPIIGMIGGLRLGGLAVIQHYTLRGLLVINKKMYFRIIPFLDHCVDLIFLRRVGGGYIFVHRLLMEHFAEMYVETTK